MQIYTGIAEIFADSAYLSMTTESALSAARSVTIALPALWLVIAEANAWLCDWICRRLFHLMDCERYFLPAEDEGITTPRYFGVLVLLLSFLLLTTSYRQNPRIYAVLTNCVLTIFPAATYVGLHEAALRIRDRLTEAYLIGRGHRTRTVVVIALLLLCSFATTAFAQLPSVKLKDINGKVVDTATLSNDGKPFIISFFATRCKPCNRELKAIHELYPEWQEETGVRVIAISIDEAQNAQKVKPMVDAAGWEYQVLLDPNSDFRRAMGVNLIPHVFVIDGEGKVAESRSGYTDGGELHLIEKVRELLGE